MDADHNIIPIVDDDQGEGFKDPINDLEELQKAYKKSSKEHASKQQAFLKQMLINRL